MTLTQAIAIAIAQGLERIDAQRLLLRALARPANDRAWLLARDSDALPAAAQVKFEAAVQRRLQGEPLAYITGSREFYGLTLQVDARVLDPRADTETLVDWALELMPPLHPEAAGGTEPYTVLDLGTGSGAIALALKHSRPHAQVSALDASTEALAVARANAQQLALDVTFSHSTWLDQVQGRYHLIVSNPPYIAAQDPHLAALQHEPLQALASGPDGLDDIRRIIATAPAHLHPGAWLLLEHGYDQAEAVRALLREAGYEDVQSRRDLTGIERCSGGRLLSRHLRT